MRISPLDVRSQEFKKTLRGYDPEEVKAFLDAVADTMEDLLKEKEKAAGELAGLRKKVETFTEMELSLRDAMVAAQKAADEAKMNARRNADLMIREAELEVRQRIAEAKRQVDDVFRARETVRAEMRAFLPRLRSLLETQLTYLENIEQEVTGMDLGDGEPPETKEVESLASTVESRALEAEAEAREEMIREQERAIERRRAAAEAARAEAGGQPAHEGRAEAGGAEAEHAEAGERDPLDEAMRRHHQTRVMSQAPGQADHGGESGEDHGEGRPAPAQAASQPPEHEEATRGGEHEPARQVPAGDSPWRPEPAGGGPLQEEELRIQHTEQHDDQTEKREDVST